MTHRWGLADAQAWRRLAETALLVAEDMERRGEVRPSRAGELVTRVKRACKAYYPCHEPEWPRFTLFIRLCEDFGRADDAWRRSWTAALDGSARAILARLDAPGPPPGRGPRAVAAAAQAHPPWWVGDGK